MKVSNWSIVVMLLWVGVGCAITPTATPSSVSIPMSNSIPTPTLVLPNPTGVLSTQIPNRIVPADVPACPGAIDVEKPIEFVWTGMENVRQSTPESNWTYYRCNKSQTTVAAFYQRWMPEQYRWLHNYREEHAEAILDVYFYSTGTSNVPSRWLYLWFLPDTSAKQNSYLAIAWWEAPKSC